ncbi:SHOCT domain-containing protein [Bacteroidota bacterium]
MKYIQLLSFIVLAALATSCATVLTGSTQRVTIDSTPQGAEIIIDGQLMGTTPAKITMQRDINALVDDAKFIELNYPGYYPEGYRLGTELEPICILNVFWLPGFAVDAVTGALMKYDSNYYNFRMVPVEASANTAQPQPLASNSVDSDGDDYEKLMKLVELYEEGLITKEEFEAEKAKIFERKRQ